MVSHSPQVLGLSPGWLEYFQSMFQAASQGSPMTVTINGENVEDINNIEITQNAADEESPLTCVPDCPQEEYEYNYEVHLVFCRTRLFYVRYYPHIKYFFS